MSYKARDIIRTLLADRNYQAQRSQAEAFAPVNIALVKYWGKRCALLNLPHSPSLSVSLPGIGTRMRIRETGRGVQDEVYLNDKPVSPDTALYQRLSDFLDLFRVHVQQGYRVDSQSTVAVGAGLASSASAFAATVLALNALYDWQLELRELSILSRLGSGSACRSLWPGFVEWRCGEDPAGWDSHGVALDETWPELRIGLWILDQGAKPLSSRLAMQQTQDSAPGYAAWAQQGAVQLEQIRAAIAARDFTRFGQLAEQQAWALHALLQTAWPPILYSSQATWQAREQVLRLRAQGLPIYFTQDAGPNLKILFLAEHQTEILDRLPHLQVIAPFADEVSP